MCHLVSRLSCPFWGRGPRPCGEGARIKVLPCGKCCILFLTAPRCQTHLLFVEDRLIERKLHRLETELVLNPCSALCNLHNISEPRGGREVKDRGSRLRVPDKTWPHDLIAGCKGGKELHLSEPQFSLLKSRRDNSANNEMPISGESLAHPLAHVKDPTH